MPYSPLRPYPKSSGLDPNYAPEGMLACLPENLDDPLCAGCHYLMTRCPTLYGKPCCTAPCRQDGLSVIFKPR